MALSAAACDQSSAEKTSSAADEALPAATTAPGAGEPVQSVESVEAEAEPAQVPGSSMDGESPAGEGVSAGDIPHSDVPPPSRAVFTDAECNFEDWVGSPVSEAEAAAKETGRPYRILTPDSMMTMDHSPDRINVVHEKDGKVTRVWCG
jgi:hypothetical protein